MIASEDLDALDAFEQLIRASLDPLAVGQPELAVFYLKFAKAEAAAEHLKRFLGAAGDGSGAGGGSLLSSLAGAALGESGGGLIGSLLGLGGGGGQSVATTSAVTIMADARLNALLVKAAPEELELAEQLLEVIDQNNSPEEVATTAKPRLIPVLNMNARDLATILREIYVTRIAGDGAPQRQPTPDEFFRALRGQSSGRSAAREMVLEQQRMTISVDSRSNSLIVAAPDPLFQEVLQLVTELDQVSVESTDTMRVVTIRRSNPEVVQRALASVLGNAVRTRGDQQDRGGPSPERDRRPDRPEGRVAPPPNPEQMREQMRRRIELFRALQRAGQQAQQGRRGG
jgi:hypothetical protein